MELKPRGTPRSALADAFVRLLLTSGLISIEDAKSLPIRDHVRTVLGRSQLGLADLRKEWLPKVDCLLVLVDPFEELFRYQAAPRADGGPPLEDEPEAFVSLLLAAAASSDAPVSIMITLRADYIGDCVRFEGLPEAISRGHYLVPRLTREQLEEVIGRPIAKARATIDHDLVQQLLNDSAKEADALPVLQHALMRLWHRAGYVAPNSIPGSDTAPGLSDASAPFAAGPDLTLESYLNDLGGMRDALSKHADEVTERLDAAVVEQVVRALTEIDKRGRAVRRAVRMKQLVAETGSDLEEVRNVVDKMRRNTCSFLRPPEAEPITDDTFVDIGHEALIIKWRKISNPDGITGQPKGWLFDEEHDGRVSHSPASECPRVMRSEMLLATRLVCVF